MMPVIPRHLAPLAMICAATACLSTSPTPPATLCVDPRPSAPCRTATAVEGWLHRPDIEIVAVSEPEKGKQGTRILTLAVPHGDDRIVFRAKWRSIATSSKLNNPRAELAAYAVQRLVLEPHEYVVPPARGHCFELEHYRAHVDVDADEPPSFAKTNCVYGILSYWLEGALTLKLAAKAGWFRSGVPYDAALFARNASYRQSVADMNLFAHLISHGDAHPNQFVVTGGPARPLVYMVDNSTSFTSFRNKTIERGADWSEIIVPALRRAVVERLGALDPSHLDTLAVVEQYELRDGILVPTRRTPATSQRSSGFRWMGNELQVGLTEAEIAMLRSRIAALVARAASGDTRIF
jgi:hypothetical protein